jgi:hypothetical protein
LPKLYRLARTVAKPKAVFVIVPPEGKLRDYIYGGTPDDALRHAPIGPFMDKPSLLVLDKAIWDTPLLKYAPAARDMAIYGGYDNLQGVGMEAYAVDTHGDRVSYLMTWAQNDLPASKRTNQSWRGPHEDATGADAQSPRRLAESYFARIDIDAMDELRGLVEGDGGRIYVISHAPAATLWGGMADDAGEADARRGFFKALCERLGAKFIDVAPTLDIPTYAISDMTHLNTYGAEMYTRAAFGIFAGIGEASAETRAVRMRPPPKGLFPTTDKTFNTYAALVRRPANEAHPLLRFKLVDTLAVPRLPQQDLYVALRTPANEDVVAPAIPIGPHEFVAEVDLPSVPQDEALVLRIVCGEGGLRVASSNPLEDYEWIDSFPRKPLPATRSAGQAQVVAWPPVRYPGQSLYVSMRPGAPLPSAVSFRLEPRSTSLPALDLGTVSGDFAKLVKVALPADAKPGEYVLRMRDPATQRPLDPAPVVKVALRPEPARVAVESMPSLHGGHITVRWSGIQKPTPNDWLGLFPVGGGPKSRLDLTKTKGLGDGQVRIPIAGDVAAKLAHGNYEFRLYAGNGWEVLAVSDPFTLEPRPESRAAADGSAGAR